MSELPEWWTGPYPEVSSAQTAADYIDALGGALSRRQENGHWVLTTGSQDLVTADTEPELDTFVLGFALAHLIVERHGLIGRRPGPAAAGAETAATPEMATAESAAPAADSPGLSVVPDEPPGGDTESSAAADLEPGDDDPDAEAGADADAGTGGGGGRRRGGRNRRR